MLMVLSFFLSCLDASKKKRNERAKANRSAAVKMCGRKERVNGIARCPV